MGTLYICPTPIGNLDDVSQRLIDVLNNVDLIYCEDTRRAKKLLNHFGIETGIESYFIGNEVNKIEDIKSHLGNNLNLALISDAGTPLISDPGNKLVETIIKEGFRVESIPGPSSVLVALTLSGFDISNFQFLGFIPKSGKEKSEFLTKLLNAQMPSVCFTSPKRVIKDLDYFEKNGLNSQITVCRELTKKFETIHRGDIAEVKEKLSSDNLKGEITLVIAPSELNTNVNFELDSALKILLYNGVPKRDLAKAVSLITDIPTNEIYDKIKDS